MKTLLKIFICLCVICLFSCKTETNSNTSETKQVVVSNTSLDKVEPPHWWIGFKDQALQLLVKEDNIGSYTPEINYTGISIDKVHTAKSKNYLFIDLQIANNTKAGKFDIVFKKENGEEKTHTYELKDRVKASGEYFGFDSSDAIFLITPDRFANGDESNDIVQGLNETLIDRIHGYKRHGGDLRGIINHVDYIHDLGYTAIWPTLL